MSGPVDYFPPGLNLFGGLPTSVDKAPSILFVILYSVLLPFAIFRGLIDRETRSRLFLRPVIFILIRIATFVIRAVQAWGNYGESLFIAEQVLLLSGFFFLIDPIVELVTLHLGSWAVRGRTNSHVNLATLIELTRLALLAALIMAIYCSTQYSNVDQPGVVNTITTLRLAIGGIAMGVTGLCFVLSVMSYRPLRLNGRRTIWLVPVSLILAGISAYRLGVTCQPESLLSHRTKALFYVFSALLEFIACVCYFVVNLRERFHLDLLPSTFEKLKIRFGLAQPRPPIDEVEAAEIGVKSELVEGAA